MTTIVLADDHEIVRKGLRALLERDKDFNVVAEAANGLSAVELAGRLRPDVLIVDYLMSGLNGPDVIRQVSQRSPKTKFIVLSMHSNEAYVMESLKAGAIGYALKDASASELLRAVRDVADGRNYFSAPLSKQALEAYLQRSESAPDAYDSLTDREREALHLVAEGLTSAKIAEQLHISPRTVEIHRANMMRKRDLHSTADVIRYAIRRGITPIEQP